DGAMANLGTLSHEFFHCWNMERIRSAAIEPFDFERANMSGELWLGEGFTSYYDDLIIHRAGLSDLDQYAAGVGRLLNATINAPGRRFFSPVEMSMQAPFVDAATSIDPTNQANTFLSYYTWGAAIGLGLDLTLRTRFDGLTLDDYMRALWETHGKPGAPYTLDDLRAALARVTGDAEFAETFFRRYITGHDVVDYAALLAHAGLLLRKADPDGPTLGRVGIRFGDDGAIVATPTLVDSPLYEAGVDRGDRIISLGGREIHEEADLRAALAGRAPGDVLTIEFEQRGRHRTASLALAADPRLEVVTFEAAGRQVTDAIRAFRAAWLGSKQPAKASPVGAR
ncbi:MAG TPA: PDZ domain-containing protein, partial [Longimicrobiales bacterium]